MSIKLSKKVVLILGKNGAGKTNFLEAIYQVCVLKNFRSLPESLLINDRAQEYTLFANFNDTQSEAFTLGINANAEGKKVVLLNQKPLKKLSSYIGKSPVMFFSPDDGYLLLEASENRRKLIDAVLSQSIEGYLTHLQLYNKYLQQRNAYLKSLIAEPFIPIDDELLKDYALLMEPSHQFIVQSRKVFSTYLQQRIQELYTWLSGIGEMVEIIYEPNLEEGVSLALFLNDWKEKELHSGRTAAGNHKDDWNLIINQKLLKKAGSQGQIKSFVIALKMACIEYLEKNTGIKPIVLLDDVFDKLDDTRIAKLLSYIQSEAVGQVFLTDARPERSIVLLNAVGNTQAEAFQIIDNELKAFP